jgi:hypothetical protein
LFALVTQQNFTFGAQNMQERKGSQDAKPLGKTGQNARSNRGNSGVAIHTGI